MLHKDLTGLDLHIPKLHAPTHLVGGTDPLGLAESEIAGLVTDLAAKKADSVTATDKVLGRASAGAGAIEEIACTAAGRALLDDADTAAQRTTLGGVPVGPSSSVAGHLATFADTTGKVVQDGGAPAKFNTGGYSGDGTANRAISVGFQPKLMMVWTVATGTCVRIDAIDGGRGLTVSSPAGNLSATTAAGVVLSATGFITGDSANGDGCNSNGYSIRWDAWG